jgi:hypothetical protein
MRHRSVLALFAISLAGSLLLGLWSPPAALAALIVTRSELNGDQLRVEGQGAVPDAAISIDGVVRGAADSTGKFRVEATGFSSPTCKITVSDGASSVPATLAGCTPSAPSTLTPTLAATTPAPTPIPTATPASGVTGSLSIIPGGNGSGTITSQPAGINCTITNGNGAGSCKAFFPAGTVVRLDARPAADTRFQGWRGLPGCGDPSKITIFANTNISCQPGFQLKF